MIGVVPYRKGCERCVRGLPLYLWAALALSRVTSTIYIEGYRDHELEHWLPFIFASAPKDTKRTLILDPTHPFVQSAALLQSVTMAAPSSLRINGNRRLGGFEQLHTDQFSLLQAAIIGLSDDSPLLEGYLALHDRLPIHTLFLDVDGVLTDGRVSVDSAGNIHRRYSIQDGAALKRLINSNISVVWLSAAAADPSITARATMLGIPSERVFCSVRHKEEFIAQYTQNQSLWGCAFVGDEKRDVRAMQVVGHSYCPSDAQPPALRASLNILHRSGGSGVLVEIEKDIQRRNRTIST